MANSGKESEGGMVETENYSAWRMWVVIMATAIIATGLIGGSIYRIIEFLLF